MRCAVFECRRAEVDDVAVIVPSGDLDWHSVTVFRQALRAGAVAGLDIVVDLERLNYIDSGGVHVLLVYGRLLAERRRRVLLAAPQSTVRRVLELVDARRRLPVFQSVDAALASCSDGGVAAR